MNWTKDECTAALVDILGKRDRGMHLDDRRTRSGEHLDRRLRWWESEGDLKRSTLESYREAIELYLRPAYGHMRLAEMRDHHFRDLAAAMRMINRPEADSDTSDLLRRLLAARATREGRRISSRPLTDARIHRVLAVASSALGDLVPHTLPVNPAAGVKVGKQRKVKPLLWTAARVEHWQRTGEILGRVMVWTREHCGEFLDGIEDERLYALYHLAAYFGLRRSEIVGLCWMDVDLTTRRIHVHQAQVDDELDSTKSEDSERIIIDGPRPDQDRPSTAEVLKDWRKSQLAERMAWGSAWTDSGRVFTREDGTPLRPGWASTRFDTLAGRAGPPGDHPAWAAPRCGHDGAGRGPATEGDQRGSGAQHRCVHMDVYTEVAGELADAAASAIAAYVPRKPKIVTGGTIIGPSGGRNAY